MLRARSRHIQVYTVIQDSEISCKLFCLATDLDTPHITGAGLQTTYSSPRR